MKCGVVENLFIGKPKLLSSLKADKEPYLSSIQRQPVSKLNIMADSLEGDLCANLKYHGGPDRIVHQMSARAYDLWRRQFPEFALRFVPGLVGENLYTSSDMHDGNVCIGDIYQIGSALLQVTEGRNPCVTIDDATRVPKLYQFIKESCVSGWMYRVLKAGVVALGDDIILKDRPNPRVSVERAFQVLVRDKGPRAQILELQDVKEFSDRWKQDWFKSVC